MIERLPDWRQRWRAYIVAHRGTPLVWGASDCFLTSCNMIQAMTGEDIAPTREYSSERGAIRQLLTLGFCCVADLADSLLPRTTRARAGDLIIVEQHPLDACMIANGYGDAWHQGEHGLQLVAIPDNALAWKV